MDVHRIDFDGADLVIRSDGDWRGFRSNACAKEPETAAWVRRVARRGVIFFDIGACVGSYSLIAASLGATVHAFEPVAVNYAQLQQNIWLNGLDGISAWPLACTDTTALRRIDLSSTAPGAASHSVTRFNVTPPDSAPVSQPAIGVSLDSFISDYRLPTPGHIKIDVDGGEVSAIEGARKTLRNVESVMVEVSPQTEPSVASILIAAGLEKTGSWPRTGNQSNHLYERLMARID